MHIVDIIVRIQRNTDENLRIIKHCFSDREVFDAIFWDKFLVHERKLTAENVLERICCTRTVGAQTRPFSLKRLLIRGSWICLWTLPDT